MSKESKCQCVMRCQKLQCQKTCLCYAIRNEDIAYINFCLQFVSFKFHAVSITRRFHFPVHGVSSVELSAVSNTRRFQSSCVTRRFLYTRAPPLSLLHEDSVTHRFRYPRIQRAPLFTNVVAENKYTWKNKCM